MPEATRSPLVELHLHLEGAIPHAALAELVRKYEPKSPLTDPDRLARRFVYRDFPHFIDMWVWKNGFLREYEDFAFIAEQAARSLTAQGVRYAEVFYSPGDHAARGLVTQGLTTAIRQGLDRVPEVEVKLITDLIRDTGPIRAARTLREVAEVRDQGVIGVGIGGSEQSYPPEPFGPVYEEARSAGFHVTAHAGEAAGAASIWGALRTLGVERIGHGVRAFEDRALLDHLAEHQVPLEMCPISNVRTRVVDRIEDHPIRRYFDLGILVTVSTDDPAMFGTSLDLEYGALKQSLGFTEAEVNALRRNAITASWMPEQAKARLLNQAGAA